MPWVTLNKASTSSLSSGVSPEPEKNEDYETPGQTRATLTHSRRTHTADGPSHCFESYLLTYKVHSGVSSRGKNGSFTLLSSPDASSSVHTRLLVLPLGQLHQDTPLQTRENCTPSLFSSSPLPPPQGPASWTLCSVSVSSTGGTMKEAALPQCRRGSPECHVLFAWMSPSIAPSPAPPWSHY